eukprot:CAMPEP_0170570352 /NCGR_PEP_ID=MMETSP0224-20130122/1059_1 /TAXON_ID=285029 /ORGANISM="Togula jolla, Strain CCCM 725" /LENGTH=44 /DNA_ID= /DNA_START= /DNA_END= /DNA_ORIENTATION=
MIERAGCTLPYPPIVDERRGAFAWTTSAPGIVASASTNGDHPRA